MKKNRIQSLAILTLGLVLITWWGSGCQKKTIPQTSQTNIELRGKDLQNYTYLFSEALKNKILGDIPRSIQYYERCLSIKPDSDASMYELSSLYSIVGDYQKSLQYARLARNTDPENLWYQLQLANLYRAFNQNDSSIFVYEHIIRNFEDRPDLAFNLGNLYRESGRYNDALKIFSRLEDQFGQNENIILSKHEIYEAQGNYQEAELQVEKLLAIDPQRIEFLVMYAEIQYVQDKHEKAEGIYEKLEKISPDNELLIISRLGYYEYRGDEDNLVAQLKVLIDGKAIKMETKLQVFVSLIEDPGVLSNGQIENALMDLRSSHPGEIRITALLADFYTRKGNYEKAREEYLKYLEKEKSNYLVWEQLLFISNILGNNEELYQLSQEALRLFRSAPIPYFFNGVACTQLNKYQEAVNILNEGIQFVGENKNLLVQYYAMLGDAYRNLGQHRKSDEAFEEALKIDPENTIVLNNYSYYLALRGADLKNALRMSGKTIKTEPENATYLDTYGWILFVMEKYDQARRYLKKAVENSADPSPEILEHYGDVLAKTGDMEAAITYWKKAIDSGGEPEQLTEKIKNAQQR